MVRAKGGEQRTALFSDKGYKEGIDDLSKMTVVRATDLDDKAIKFLDYLERSGRAQDACQHLKTALEGLQRDHVSNWRAYVYTLLRGFDKTAYEAMKTEEGKRVRPPRNSRADKDGGEKKEKFPLTPFVFNPLAAEFTPGQQRPEFNPLAAEFTPGKLWGKPEAPTTVTLSDDPALAASPPTECEASGKAAEDTEAKPEEKGEPQAAGEEAAEPKAEEEKKD